MQFKCIINLWYIFVCNLNVIFTTHAIQMQSHSTNMDEKSLNTDLILFEFYLNLKRRIEAVETLMDEI